jgi:hypothetical protein
MMVIEVIFDKIRMGNPLNVFAKLMLIENCPSGCGIKVSIHLRFLRFAAEKSTLFD